MCNFSKANFTTISNTSALKIIMIWFAKETANHLSDQLLSAIVMHKSLAVRRPTFSYSSAFYIMYIHTEWQSQAEESCVFQMYPPFQSSGQLFTSLIRPMKPHIIQSIVTAALSIVILRIISQILSAVRTASVAVNIDDIQTQLVHIPFGSTM